MRIQFVRVRAAAALLRRGSVDKKVNIAAVGLFLIAVFSYILYYLSENRMLHKIGKHPSFLTQ